MTCPQLILLGGFTRPHQVAQGFGGGIGNPYLSQIASAVTPRQSLGVSPVGLDPIPGLDRRQGRRDDRALYAQLAQLPIENIARWTSFITGTQLLHRTQLPNQLAYRFRPVGDDAKTPNLTVGFGDGN